MKIALHGRNFKEEAKPYIQTLFNFLGEKNVEIQLSESFIIFLTRNQVRLPSVSVYSEKEPLTQADFAFSIGGDGTLLEILTQVGSLQIPIVGINTGRLGFLATTSPDEILKNAADLFNRSFTIDERTLIRVESDKDIFDSINFGLNEFTIARRDTSSMITVRTYIDGEYLNSYWADGLIVS
ncbi:MAG: NAD(+)/NADH kinase, partial [Verrucomicrobia bacterium]|nr:NAD(+)/NADH kinase [Cytophagales bacterium]